MSKGTALVKQRDRYKSFIVKFPERADFYRTKIVELNEEIRVRKVCIRCGRELKSETAQANGFGDECRKAMESEVDE